VHWRLIVWFDRQDFYQEFDFDEKPKQSSGEDVVTYTGTLNGQELAVRVNKRKATLWMVQQRGKGTQGE
jgi:hypothetical protein